MTATALKDNPSHSSTHLGGLKVGDVAVITSVEGNDIFRRRILEMGLVPGEKIFIERKAPMGDPIVVRVQGYQLGLRKVQAMAIRVSTEKNSNFEPLFDSVMIERGSDVVLQKVALIGNPNCGKTTVFNALTGMRQKVGNYAGVTVEKREGRCRLTSGQDVDVIDLPGTYSLSPTSPDERIAVDVLRGEIADLEKVDGALVVVDASNLARNLLLFTQVAECGLPLVVGLTMMDTSERKGLPVNIEVLERHLGVPVIPLNAKRNQGLEELKAALSKARIPMGRPWEPSEAKADDLMSDVSSRYRWIAGVMRMAVGSAEPKKTWSDKIDNILVHRGVGLIFFALLMTTIFYLIYAVADPIMGAAEDAVGALGSLLFEHMSDGPLKSLLMDGVIGGVGGVVVFVPQIAVLFLCISVLEESGYLARAAFLLDRLLAVVGLHGKSFIPLLSSHACAIPGIMAARSIESQRDRMATMFVAPFMSCGARLPVYALLIGVFLRPYGAFMQGVALFSCYSLGIVVAILTALVLKKTALKEPPAAFLLELPSYQIPILSQVFRIVFRNSWMFVRKAGTVILGFSILLWAALYYPRMDESQTAAVIEHEGMTIQQYSNSELAKQELDGLGEEALEADQLAIFTKYGVNEAQLEKFKIISGEIGGAQVEQSWAGRGGKLIEPFIRPLGYDWKIGIGLIGAFAAREVFVSTIGVVYSIGDDADEENAGLHAAMRSDLRDDGTKLWTIPTVLSVLVFFVIAMQCISTIAVMRQETGSWKWPLIQLISMNGIAYLMAMCVYQLTTAFGGFAQ